MRFARLGIALRVVVPLLDRREVAQAFVGAPVSAPIAPIASQPAPVRPQATLIEQGRPGLTAPDSAVTPTSAVTPARTLNEPGGGLSAGRVAMIVGGASLALGVVVGALVMLLGSC